MIQPVKTVIIRSGSISDAYLSTMHNFGPYCPRAKVSQTYSSPAHKLNGFVYHQNWLHNLLIATSLSGIKP